MTVMKRLSIHRMATQRRDRRGKNGEPVSEKYSQPGGGVALSVG